MKCVFIMNVSFFKDIALETRLLGQISQIRSFFTMSQKPCYRKWVNKVGDMKTCTDRHLPCLPTLSTYLSIYLPAISINKCISSARCSYKMQPRTLLHFLKSLLLSLPSQAWSMTGRDTTWTCGADNGGCSHLCLPNPRGVSCACPTGIQVGLFLTVCLFAQPYRLL